MSGSAEGTSQTDLHITARPRLSVIVPLYNDEAYIGQNLTSLIQNARHLEMEIIVVNDGSTDNSLSAAQSALAGTTIPHTIITTPNCGLSGARNTGLERARGDYVGFLDSDDLMAPDIYHKLVEFGDDRRCDQIFARSVIYDDQTGQTAPFYDAEVWDQILGDKSARAFNPLSEPHAFRTQPKTCARIWRTSYLAQHNLEWPEGRFFEDIGVHLLAMVHNGTVGILNETGLFYRQGHAGRITGVASLRRFDIIDNASELLGETILKTLKPKTGGYLLGALLRFVMWGRMNMEQPIKSNYDSGVAGLFTKINPDWLREAARIEPKVTRRFLKTVIRHGSAAQRLRAAWILLRTLTV